MRLHCLMCGRIVSTEVPDNTVVRAWIECPECLEAEGADVIEDAQEDPHPCDDLGESPTEMRSLYGYG